MTLVKVNNPINRPFDGLMKEFFNEFPTHFGRAWKDDAFGFPPVNIFENETGYQLAIAAPGFNKQDFSVKLENQLLTISSEKTEEKNESTEKMIRKEFSHRSFKRSFTLDEKIDAAKIEASYDNGILNIKLPKKETVVAATKEITIR
jgi:HSP20 family protein